jgi:hypothetical protein
LTLCNTSFLPRSVQWSFPSSYNANFKTFKVFLTYFPKTNFSKITAFHMLLWRSRNSRSLHCNRTIKIFGFVFLFTRPCLLPFSPPSFLYPFIYLFQSFPFWRNKGFWPNLVATVTSQIPVRHEMFFLRHIWRSEDD